MSQQMQNAQKFYMRGIQDGQIDEVHRHYMGASYTQHSTGVPDGKEGFKAFFQDFFQRNPERQILYRREQFRLLTRPSIP